MYDDHPEFEKIANKDIIYKDERAAYPQQEGGYWIECDYSVTGRVYVTKNPIGKVIVVI